MRNVKTGIRNDITQTELVFNEILNRSGMLGLTADFQYSNINSILNARNAVTADIQAAGMSEDVSLVGSITEQICRIGLEAAAPDRYSKLPKNWKWIGDFAITGLPFNIFVSVKSYYARERLIVSGTGQGAAPVIGYGLFRDSSEWNPSRVNQYKHRSFIAIYMPLDLYNCLASLPGAGHPVTSIMNLYERPFIRNIADFASDVRRIITGDKILRLETF